MRDSGEIIGQPIADSTRRDIASEIKKIKPTPSVEVDYIKRGEDKSVIAIHVKAGEHAPYTYDGRPYQRDESETNRMSQHRYEQLLVKRGQLNHSWEEMPATSYNTIDDLDHDEIRLAVKQGIAVERIPATVEKESIPSILKSWKLFDGETINNAAVVLFAKDVRPFYAQCHIKLGRFRGTSMLNDFIDNKDFYGNAFRLYDEADSFIRRHLPIASIFDHDKGERIDRPALPVFAVREALVNAICHCDYSNRSSSITLAIFDDRMEIWNKGLLPKDINLKNLDKKHRSEPRNRAIAKVFYDRKYFEGWGTGISKIFDLCREDRLPDPKYSQDSGGTEITFMFREPIAITYIMEKKQKLTERQNEIIKLLKKEPLNSAHLAEKLKNSPTIRTVQTDLIKLEKAGIIRQEGKLGQWCGCWCYKYCEVLDVRNWSWSEKFSCLEFNAE